MSRLKVGLVGCGQMGTNHARVIAECNAADLDVVVDLDAETAARVAARHGARSADDLDAVTDCDAVVVASSTAARMEVVGPLLEAGIPTLVEKPFAPTVDQLDELLTTATNKDVPVMCGFVERFNASFQTAVRALDGPPIHLLAVRHSPPTTRIASSVVHDLMLHDLDAAQRLFGAAEGKVVGAACVRPESSAWTEIADCTIAFDNGAMATLSASRLGQRKIRSLVIYTLELMVEVDLLRQDVTVFRNMSQAMSVTGGGLGYRSSTEVELPFVRHVGEPLSLQFGHFLDLVAGSADHVEERRQIWPAHLLAEDISNCPTC
ncbi:MAG: Gfo/Idh/MocA family oxidoreductase [Microthrixaceae bacterium]